MARSDPCRCANEDECHSVDVVCLTHLQPSHLEPPHAEWLPGACSGQAKANSSAELAATFVGFSKAIARLRDEKGLSASVYTQLTDVETECNGLLTYDRVWKLDAAGVRAVSAANDALTGGNL